VRRFLSSAAVSLIASFCLTAAAQDDTLTAGFIYVGPTDDNGWTQAHDEARQLVDEEFDWLETIAVESVPEADAEPFIDQLVQQGAEVIFTTSFGFMDATLAAAARYPEVIFAHATGFMRAPNVATYTAEFYQVYYLNGLLAGALTESGTVGYVGAFPIPEVKRHIDAFTLGVRAVNPEATVNVRWINAWYNPAAATEATQALIAEGADVFAFTEDSPTVIQVAAAQDLPSFAHYSPMLSFAPEHVVSGQLVHWDVIYRDFLSKVQDGTYTAQNLQDVDYWSLLYSGAVAVGADNETLINPAFEETLRGVMVEDAELGEVSVFDLMMARLEAMSQETPAFDPFTGPISDRNGNEVVAAGETMSVEELASMQWAVEGVVGPWPDEPQ
jgi:basic membrane protein A and related proteins